MDVTLSWCLASYPSWRRRAIATVLGPRPSPSPHAPGSDQQAGEEGGGQRSPGPGSVWVWVWVEHVVLSRDGGCACLHVCEHMCGCVWVWV